jgi:hypothetical protein
VLEREELMSMGCTSWSRSPLLKSLLQDQSQRPRSLKTPGTSYTTSAATGNSLTKGSHLSTTLQLIRTGVAHRCQSSRGKVRCLIRK